MSTPDDPFTKRPSGSEPLGGAPSYGSVPSYPTPTGTPQYGTPQYGSAPEYGTPSYDAPAFGAPPSAAGFGPGTGRPPLASWGVRALGYVIDAIIAIVVQRVVGLVSGGLADVVGLLIWIGFGYLTGTTGQTPGRKAMGIRVLRESDGQVLGAGAGIGRAFLHILDALPILLGYFWPIWDRKNQTFADKIIGSVVVKG